MWSPDRLHGNADSHERMAAACAEVLGLPGADGWWRAPLPPLAHETAIARLADHVAWGRRLHGAAVAPQSYARPAGRGAARLRKHDALVDIRP